MSPNIVLPQRRVLRNSKRQSAKTGRFSRFLKTTFFLKGGPKGVVWGGWALADQCLVVPRSWPWLGVKLLYLPADIRSRSAADCSGKTGSSRVDSSRKIAWLRSKIVLAAVIVVQRAIQRERYRIGSRGL